MPATKPVLPAYGPQEFARYLRTDKAVIIDFIIKANPEAVDQNLQSIGGFQPAPSQKVMKAELYQLSKDPSKFVRALSVPIPPEALTEDQAGVLWDFLKELGGNRGGTGTKMLVTPNIVLPAVNVHDGPVDLNNSDNGSIWDRIDWSNVGQLLGNVANGLIGQGAGAGANGGTTPPPPAKSNNTVWYIVGGFLVLLVIGTVVYFIRKK